jgi:hypothetical protein
VDEKLTVFMELESAIQGIWEHVDRGQKKEFQLEIASVKIGDA